MKLQTLCAPIVALAVAAPLARSQPAPTSPGPTNAALLYWPALMTMQSWPESDIKIVRDWQHVPIDEKAKSLIEPGTGGLMRNSFDQLHAAAQVHGCDWGLDLSQGPYLLLPHLNAGKLLSQRECLRIRYDLEQKNGAAAASDTIDVLALARNLAHEPIMISRLVQYSIERDAITAIASGLDKMDADWLKRFESGLDQLPPSATDAASLKLESEITPQWAIGKVLAAGAHPDWHAIFGFMQISEGKPAEGDSIDAAVKAAGSTPEGVIASLRELQVFYDEASKLASTPATPSEFHQKAEALRKRYDANLFAKAMLPNLSAAHDATVAADTRMLLLKAAIAVVQRGPDAAKEFKDPVDHQPIAYQREASGFKLVSKVIARNEPVTLTVGELK